MRLMSKIFTRQSTRVLAKHEVRWWFEDPLEKAT
jgi:hypothetical protein